MLKEIPFQQAADTDSYSAMGQLDQVESISEGLITGRGTFEDIAFSSLESSDLFIADIL